MVTRMSTCSTLLLLSLIALVPMATLAFFISTDNPKLTSQQVKATFPEMSMTTTDIIRLRGYNSEKHSVTTEDGYILEIHRIPCEAANAKPVLLMHGILVTSSSWVINFQNSSLGYFLASEKFDVWLGNFRGNDYGNHHIQYSVEDGRFWQFGLDESGLYDLPAIIDYILKTTGQPKLSYIGHSMGTTAFFVMASAKPKYNEKVNAMFALSPVFFIKRPRGGLSTAITLFKTAKFSPEMWNQPVPPNAKVLRKIVAESCTGNTANGCLAVVSLLAGYTGPHINITRLPLYLSQYFATSSLRTFAQFAQWAEAKGYPTCYNFGEQENENKYRQATPPVYDPSKVTTPVYIYYSDGDFFTHPLDINDLAKGLGNLKSLINVPTNTYSHFDFIFGWDGKDIFYQHILSILKELSP